MAHRVARQLKGRAPDVPPALSPELFDLLCEMRLQLAAQQKQHAQLRQEVSAEKPQSKSPARGSQRECSTPSLSK